MFSSLATFGNIIKTCKIGTFQRNLSTIFLKLLNTYLFISKIFQKVKIVMCDGIFGNIWQTCCDNISIAMKD